MGKISFLEVLRLRAIKRVSPDKSVTRSAQDDDFVVSWRCKKQRLLGLLLSARQVSEHGGTRPAIRAAFFAPPPRPREAGESVVYYGDHCLQVVQSRVAQIERKNA
jgi:hypothetical protein